MLKDDKWFNILISQYHETLIFFKNNPIVWNKIIVWKLINRNLILSPYVEVEVALHV